LPIQLTPEMRSAITNALADRAPCLLATAGADGMPDVSYRGSVCVLDDERLAFWERSMGEALRNMRSNAQACIFYRNPETRKAWRFYGRVTLLADGDLRQRIATLVPKVEIDRDPERKGVAVVLEIDRIREGGRVIQER
jgi:predicted pyridoxine 5'-phosphate oxidase superfamily flavin-nucleotide-binding protein